MTNLGHNCESKHVRIRVHKKLMPKFLAAIPKGFDVTIYPVHKPDPRNFYDENIRNMTINVTERFPDPRFRHTKEDIDTFLASLNKIDPRIKLISDRVTTKDQPQLMTEPWIKIETLLDKPGLAEDSEMDKLVSRAENIHEIKIKESQLKQLNDYYQKSKKEFIRTRFKSENLKQLEERDEETGEKQYLVRMGEI